MCACGFGPSIVHNHFRVRHHHHYHHRHQGNHHFTADSSGPGAGLSGLGGWNSRKHGSGCSRAFRHFGIASLAERILVILIPANLDRRQDRTRSGPPLEIRSCSRAPAADFFFFFFPSASHVSPGAGNRAATWHPSIHPSIQCIRPGFPPENSGQSRNEPQRGIFFGMTLLKYGCATLV